MKPLVVHAWMDDALCAEIAPELMFPPKGSNSQPAKEVCGGCEVVAQCLQYALENNLRVGVYGAMSARRRRPLHAAYNEAHGITDEEDAA